MSETPSLDRTPRLEPNMHRARNTAKVTLEAAIDRAPGRAFVMLSAVYFAVVLVQSWFKLLWLDELITLHIAKYGGPAAIWEALKRGADPNPPVTHLLVHYSAAVFGDHTWAYRLPAMVGYWLGMLCLFLYLRRRVPGTWAIVGTLISMCMAAFEYSFESRSYAIFYGLAMLAFLCWTLAIDPMRSTWSRSLALVGVVLGLAGGISTNYFAALAFLPIAAGEGTRTILCAREQGQAQGRTRLLAAIDWRIWIGLGLAATPLIAYRGLISHSIAQFAPYAFNKVSIDQVFDSYTEMVEIILYPLLVLFVFAAGLTVGVRQAAALCTDCRERVVPGWVHALVERGSTEPPIPWHEAVGVFVFMAYPFLGFLVASIHGGMLSPRFVIPVCFGFAIAGTVVAWRTFSHLRYAAVFFLALTGAWFLSRESVVGYLYLEQKQDFYKVVDRLPEALAQVGPNAPIAIADPLFALTFRHYAPPALASRAVFPVDFPAIRQFRKDDSPEENLWAGRNFLYRLPIETMADFQRTTNDYLIIASDGNWMLDDLSYHRYALRRLPIRTRARDLGGFTPLFKGVPVFYAASWSHPLKDISSPLTLPVPFHADDNGPNATSEIYGDPPR